jgi:hypothetical protein
LCWRCLRAATRAPGDYSAFVAAGVALAIAVQACVIGSGILGLLPLSGVVTPFLSYGRSSMLANVAAVGIVMGIARRSGPVRHHMRQAIVVVATLLAIAATALAGRAVWIQVLTADRFATASTLTEQGDGGYRFEYNPRLVAAARTIGRGTIYDRHGLPLATSRADEMQSVEAAYQQAGIAPAERCAPGTVRCYPLAGIAFHVIGDWLHQTNWGARNSSYIERDAGFKGLTTGQAVQVVNPRTGARESTVKRDYRDLPAAARNRYERDDPAMRALLARNRDVHTTIDARLQLRAAAALRSRIAGATRRRRDR